MGEWLGLIGALAGTAVGGFVTYKVAGQKNAHERKAEKDRRLITACEAIHELLAALSHQTGNLSFGVIGDIGYGSKFDADRFKEKIQLDRLRMMVDFYVPALQPDIKLIRDEFEIVSRAVAEVILQRERTDEWKHETVMSAALANQRMGALSLAAQEKLAASFRAELAADS